MRKYIAQNGKLEIIETEKPSGELIEVKAVGVNRGDVFHLQGKYPSLGLEFAGMLNGKRVAGLIDGGAYAEFVEASKAAYIELPDEVDFKSAVALTEGLATAYYNLKCLCNLQAGERVLIHGGASGVGVCAVQLAKLMGAEVSATSGKAEKLKLIEKIGAEAIDYSSKDFSSERYDVILDIVGGDYFNANLRALKRGGRLAIISFLGGAKAEANLAPLLTKNLSVYGSTIRSLSLQEKFELLEDIKPYLSQLETIIDSEFSFEEAGKAISYVEEYRNLGKVVISI